MKHITPARIEQEPVAWFIEGTYADGFLQTKREKNT
jgi:PhoPQ-activated pathogenicity-related protein